MNALHDPVIAATLDDLHERAGGDEARWTERRRLQAAETTAPGPDPLIRMGEMYIAVSREEGAFLYFLARAARATQMLEFGASYGISTLYLGAAARDNGGRLVTTEVHPDKCAATRATIARAGLEGEIELLEGDALQTLAARGERVDLLFLDGWKSLYLPVLDLVLPRLVSGSVVVADNVDFEAAQDYVEHVSSAGSGFYTNITGDLALSVFK